MMLFIGRLKKKDIEAMSAVWSQGTGSLCVHPGWDILQKIVHLRL